MAIYGPRKFHKFPPIPVKGLKKHLEKTQPNMGVEPKIVGKPPKMDGENNGKPY